MNFLRLLGRALGLSLLVYWQELLELIAVIVGLYLGLYGNRSLGQLIVGLIAGAVIVNVLAVVLNRFLSLGQWGTQLCYLLGVLIVEAILLAELVLGQHLIPLQ